MPSLADKVVLHPLVLLSVVDHYNRAAADTKKRVVGVLLGSSHKGVVDVTNSFAVPFEEDDKDPTIWFLDHSYLENMFRMFKKVNAREHVVGWYSTGPRLKEADLDIHQLMTQYCDNPVLVICVEPKEIGLPFTAYASVDEVRADGTEKSRKVFVSLPTEVGQTEAEEIGVEHLLRNVKDANISTLATEVSAKLSALKGLSSRLAGVQAYLGAVAEGRLPINQDVMMHLQDIFHLLPNINVSSLASALATSSNDMLATVYLAALARCVLALHRLIDNKEQRMWAEKAAADKAAEKAKSAKDKAAGDKDKAGKDGSSKGTDDAAGDGKDQGGDKGAAAAAGGGDQEMADANGGGAQHPSSNGKA